MIMQWLREGNASWKELCLALAQEHAGHINLAKKLLINIKLVNPQINQQYIHTN